VKAGLRVVAAVAIAAISWIPQSLQSPSPVSALYCWPGDPPAVYQACVDYNKGIGQQVANQRELARIQSQINNAEAQMNAIGALINNLKRDIAAQQALIAQTQATIDDLNRQIRLGEADVTRLRAHMGVRDELLNQRLRYVDAHGAMNYLQLVLTANSFNQMMDRMVAAQQVAASDRKLLTDLAQQHSEVTLANTALDDKKGQVIALLQQEKAAEADLQKSLKAQDAALAYAKQLEVQLSAQYAAVQAQRAAIDAQVAQLQQQYQAAAKAAGGGTGQFEWPEPQCGHGCISQGFGCNSYWFEQYEPSCPYPHRIHTGIDIAGPFGTPIVAADTGVVYFYPGSFGYGNYIVMIHGNGYSTLYGHLSRFNGAMSSGAIIARGDLIGYEGSTGNSTGPHLHFEIRTNNMWRDPCIWLGC
jgi:murein DD-endopeptidase MepM/ murein hydrolase activator NlpD